MSDAIKHECGLALLRLRKPLAHYARTRGNVLYGLQRMFLLLEKQHNRGQDGAGLACLKLDHPPGEPYLFRERVAEPSPPWQTLIQNISRQYDALVTAQPALATDPHALKAAFPFLGEVYLGHLRYATHGEQGAQYCHPELRNNNWPARTLTMAGNFNLTNNPELFERLVELGQHPNSQSDTVTVLERVGHFLDEAVQEKIDALKAQGVADNRVLNERLRVELDLLAVLQRAAAPWDGGYLLGGLTGLGDLFALRDPNGIRPGYYYADDDFIVVASERQAIATSLDAPYDAIHEIPPGHAVLARANGAFSVEAFAPPGPQTSCSFERIYFSRGSDAAIYEERKRLGAALVPQVLAAVDHDLANTVFSYIPNTAQVAFWGLLKGLEDHLGAPAAGRIRAEHVITKDTKLRTFITNDAARDDLAAHVYDVTYGAIRPGQDTLVLLDDSIVRGTTLRRSILSIVSRLRPKRVVVASSAPQIRYPDCYGIDMSQIQRFIAFQAAVSLLEKTGQAAILEAVNQRCREARATGTLEATNHVQAVYAPFAPEEISAEIAALLGAPFAFETRLVYQTVADLHAAIPGHTGAWYFTGDYPTPGGNRVVNQAFLNYYAGLDVRAY